MVRLKPRLANLVTEIYASGAELLVDGQRVGIKGNPPQFIYNEVEETKKELLEALTGDPLQGPGWEARLALAKQADIWLFDQVPEEARERVEKATDYKSVVQRELNDAWIDGTFEEFRTALKKYVRTGLRAAKGIKAKPAKLEKMVMKG